MRITPVDQVYLTAHSTNTLTTVVAAVLTVPFLAVTVPMSTVSMSTVSRSVACTKGTEGTKEQTVARRVLRLRYVGNTHTNTCRVLGR